MADAMAGVAAHRILHPAEAAAAGVVRCCTGRDEVHTR